MAVTKTIEINLKGNADTNINKLNDSVKGLDQSATDLNATFEDVYGDLKPLTARMGEAEDRLYELALAGKSTTKEYKDLLGAVANYRTVQMRTDAIVDASAGTLDVKLGTALQGATSAFAGVQGAMALMGSESEELQQALLKVQGAMALAEGVRGLREGASAFTALGNSAKTALAGIRSGLIATGIGALVVALGTVVAYWDDIKSAVNGVTNEQIALNKAVETNVKAEQIKLDNLGLQDNTLRLQGKSEAEILKLKVAQTNQVITATEAQIKQNDITAKAQIDAAQRNKDILSGILNFITTPLQKLLSSIDLIGSALGKNFNLANGFRNLLNDGASLIFDPEAERAEAEATRLEAVAGLNKLKSDRDGYLLAIRNSNKTARNIEKEEIKQVQREQEESVVIRQKTDQERLNSELSIIAQRLQAERLANEERQLMREQDLENERLINEQKLFLTGALFGEIGSLLGEQTKAGKAFALAQALINTYQGISNVWAEKSESGFVGAGLAQRILTTAIVAAQGFKTVRSILKVNPKGSNSLSGGGGVGGGGAVANSAPQVNITGGNIANQIAEGIGTQQPVQAYVVANQVTTQQALDRNIVNSATLG